MIFFKRKHTETDGVDHSGQLELISIHIPKTAGTSFRLLLKNEYGEEGAVRLDLVDGVIRLENKTLETLVLPPSVRAIHGHMHFRDVRAHFDLERIPLITWLRHPVERVLSNYFYLFDRLHDLVPVENHAIIPRMVRNLEEFVEAEPNRNRIAKFLEGSTPEDFAFIGIMEHFESEIPRLAGRMNWKNRSIPAVNKTKTTRLEISDALRQHIAVLNAEDMDWYRSALELRKKAAE